MGDIELFLPLTLTRELVLIDYILTLLTSVRKAKGIKISLPQFPSERWRAQKKMISATKCGTKHRFRRPYSILGSYCMWAMIQTELFKL